MKTKKHKTKESHKVKEYKKGTLMERIRRLVEEKGAKVTYEEMLQVAKEAKPDTAFNQSHYHWYLQHFGVHKTKGKAKANKGKTVKKTKVRIKKSKVA